MKKINREKTLKRLVDFQMFEIEHNNSDAFELSKIETLTEAVQDESCSDNEIKEIFNQLGFTSIDVPVYENN